MRKKTKPKSSADVTESESNSNDAMPTTSQNYIDVSDSDGVQALPEPETTKDNDSEVYQPSRKRKVVVQRQENNRGSSEEIDSADSDKKCVFIFTYSVYVIFVLSTLFKANFTFKLECFSV